MLQEEITLIEVRVGLIATFVNLVCVTYNNIVTSALNYSIIFNMKSLLPKAGNFLWTLNKLWLLSVCTRLRFSLYENYFTDCSGRSKSYSIWIIIIQLTRPRTDSSFHLFYQFGLKIFSYLKINLLLNSWGPVSYVITLR